MLKIITRLALIGFLPFFLTACIGLSPSLSPNAMSKLLDGRRSFQGGYYKTAMHQLLPLACDGIPEAQYAVGYMYYYGYGVTQDTDVGVIWIERSAHQAYPPAVDAMKMITINGN